MSADSDCAMRSTIASSVGAGLAAGASCAREDEAMATLLRTISVINDEKRIRNLYAREKRTDDSIGWELAILAHKQQLAMHEYASPRILGNRRKFRPKNLSKNATFERRARRARREFFAFSSLRS